MGRPRKIKTETGASELQREVQETLAHVKALRDKAASGCDSLAEQAKVMASCSATLSQLGKMTGESAEIGETRILRTPAWRRIVDTISKSLTPWPSAMLAVSKALRELEG